jgi:hypothetical protein
MFARGAHLGQKHGDRPYYIHPKDVVKVLKRHGYDGEVLLCAAWLHDTIEDTLASYQDIKNAFGEDVAELVWAVTDELGRNRKERKALTWPKIFSSRNSTILKLADLAANVERSIVDRGKTLDMYRKEWGEIYPAYDKALGEHAPEACGLLIMLDEMITGEEKSLSPENLAKRMGAKLKTCHGRPPIRTGKWPVKIAWYPDDGTCPVCRKLYVADPDHKDYRGVMEVFSFIGRPIHQHCFTRAKMWSDHPDLIPNRLRYYKHWDGRREPRFTVEELKRGPYWAQKDVVGFLMKEGWKVRESGMELRKGAVDDLDEDLFIPADQIVSCPGVPEEAARTLKDKAYTNAKNMKLFDAVCEITTAAADMDVEHGDPNVVAVHDSQLYQSVRAVVEMLKHLQDHHGIAHRARELLKLELTNIDNTREHVAGLGADVHEGGTR